MYKEPANLISTANLACINLVAKTTGRQTLNQSNLLKIINARLEQDDLVLPTLPDVALEIRKRISDESVEIEEIAEIIKKDPAITARIIKFANSPFVRGVNEVDTIQKAVIRIGLKRLKTLILGFAIEQIFFASNISVATQMAGVWQQATDVTKATATTLATLHHNGRAKNLNPDVLFLISLVHNIGFLPVLTEADRLGRNSEAFKDDDLIKAADFSIGMTLTKRILKSWGFSKIVYEPAGGWTEPPTDPHKVTYTTILKLGLATTGYVCEELQKQFTDEAIATGIIKDEKWNQSEKYSAMENQFSTLF